MSSERSAGRVRKVAIAVVAAVAVAALAARIYWVNTNLPQIPNEYYDQGEWASLDGAFQIDSQENTNGYSLMVQSAKLMTYDEFVETYRTEDADVAAQPAGTHGDAHCVVDVELHIRNEGNSDGVLDAFQMVLVPARGNEYLIADIMNDAALWPQTQRGVGMQVSTRPGTEYVAHVPYVFNSTENAYLTEVTDTDFTLLVSRAPVRKMIRVHATGSS